jgi:hypothetical protein
MLYDVLELMALLRLLQRQTAMTTTKEQLSRMAMIVIPVGEINLDLDGVHPSKLGEMDLG